jgi:deoxyribodipyrimidine photo-lyase
MPSEQFDSGLVWLRRDLRLSDHAALYRAAQQCRRLYVAFIFDREILDTLPRQDRRVSFIWESLAPIDAALRERGSALIARHARAREAIPALARELGVDAVFTNHDYEPQAIERDAAVAQALLADGRQLVTSKDQVIFERDEVLTGAGKPFSVFTPYKNAWLKKLDAYQLKAYPSERALNRVAPLPAAVSGGLPSLESMGFDAEFRMSLAPGEAGARSLVDEFRERISQYHDTRDFPAVKGPSYLSVHLRFGTVSIRELARFAWQRVQTDSTEGASRWLAELIWRDFYHQILFHHPRVVTQSFKPEYDRIVWDADQAKFAAWCEGRTGFPLVDAAMLQLNTSGYMHNRLRMVVASFLTKDLGIDWRWGERYFAEKLNDFDLAANNGGWQWAASTGCDAQPYFRIFNPFSQSEKFDAQGKFIRRYLPQLAKLPDRNIHAPHLMEPMLLRAAGVNLGADYPRPIVDHDVARKKTLERFAVVKAAAGMEAASGA